MRNMLLHRAHGVNPAHQLPSLHNRYPLIHHRFHAAAAIRARKPDNVNGHELSGTTSWTSTLVNSGTAYSARLH